MIHRICDNGRLKEAVVFSEGGGWASSENNNSWAPESLVAGGLASHRAGLGGGTSPADLGILSRLHTTPGPGWGSSVLNYDARAAEAKVEALLARPGVWNAVEAIAGHLIHHGRLEGQHAEWLIQDYAFERKGLGNSWGLR